MQQNERDCYILMMRLKVRGKKAAFFKKLNFGGVYKVYATAITKIILHTCIAYVLVSCQPFIMLANQDNTALIQMNLEGAVAKTGGTPAPEMIDGNYKTATVLRVIWVQSRVPKASWKIQPDAIIQLPKRRFIRRIVIHTVQGYHRFNTLDLYTRTSLTARWEHKVRWKATDATKLFADISLFVKDFQIKIWPKWGEKRYEYVFPGALSSRLVIPMKDVKISEIELYCIVKFVLIICHSEERSDEESQVLHLTRFFASLRMTGCRDLFNSVVQVATESC